MQVQGNPSGDEDCAESPPAVVERQHEAAREEPDLKSTPARRHEEWSVSYAVPLRHNRAPKTGDSYEGKVPEPDERPSFN